MSKNPIVFLSLCLVQFFVHSIETLQQYIQKFGIFGPIILVIVQAVQVVIPIYEIVLYGRMEPFCKSYQHSSILPYNLSKNYKQTNKITIKLF